MQRRAGRSNAITKRSAVLPVLLLLGLVALAPLPVLAQETREMQEHFGRQIFRLLCVGCHGADGRGNGDVAAALDVPVGDLTTLSRRNGGVFPAKETAAAITGRSDISGHRRLAIEPWGEMFADEFARFANKPVVNQLVARRIQHLVAYLESIQR